MTMEQYVTQQGYKDKDELIAKELQPMANAVSRRLGIGRTE